MFLYLSLLALLFVPLPLMSGPLAGSLEGISSKTFPVPPHQGEVAKDLPPLPWESGGEKDPRLVERFLTPRVALPRVPQNGKDAEALVGDFLAEGAQILSPLSRSDIRPLISHFVPGRRLAPVWYVVFRQRVGEFDAPDGQVAVTIKLIEGRAVVVGVSVRLSPEAQEVTGEGALADKKILSVARQVLLDKSLISSHSSLTIVTKEIRFAEGRARLIVKVRPEEAGNFYRAYVDAHTGKAWIKEDIYHFGGRVLGRGVRSGSIESGRPLDLLPMVDLWVDTDPDQGEISTDLSGGFTMATPALPVSIEVGLKGRWSSIFVPEENLPSPPSSDSDEDPFEETDDQGLQSFTESDMILTEVVSPGLSTLDLLFDPAEDNEEETAQITAYFHTTLCHNWLKEWGIGEEIDISVPTHVNIPELCNAFYGEDGLYFFHSGVDENGTFCANSAEETTVYHECGHFIDDSIGGITDGGMSEGWGDVLAAFISGQPHLGRGQIEGQEFIRTADNDFRYPDNPYDWRVHDLGQAWAGFGWHLRESLIARLGPEEGDELSKELIIPLFYANSLDPVYAVRDLILRDDDDGDLTNGTPHLGEIQAAAERHGLRSDLNPPASVTDLAIESVGGGSVTLTWTAPGDDGSVGIVDRYEILVADDEDPDADSSGFRWVTSGPSPLPPGSRQRFTVGCLPSGRLYFSVRARDEALWSYRSNVVSAELPEYEDTSPPAVTILRPLNHATVRLPFEVEAVVRDDQCVVAIDAELRSGSSEAASYSAPLVVSPEPTPWRFTIEPDSGAVEGRHVLRILAWDLQGNGTEKEISFFIGDRDFSITSPLPDSRLPAVGAAPVSITVNPGVLMSRMEVRVDSGKFQEATRQGLSATGQEIWSFSLGSLGIRPGRHALTARGTDSTGTTNEHRIKVEIERIALRDFRWLSRRGSDPFFPFYRSIPFDPSSPFGQ